MNREFDKDFWDRQWHQAHGQSESMFTNPPNPYLARETEGLTPGTALDAGCGAGAEAIWLASHGWQVTAADISAQALARAAERAAESNVSERIQWVETDLSVSEPGTDFDLVMTHYAHPAIPQLDFYDRLATWVNIGGTLLIVGHLHTPGVTGHGHNPPAWASATAATVTACLDPASWRIVTDEEPVRTLAGPGKQEVPIHDVVVRATRLA